MISKKQYNYFVLTFLRVTTTHYDEKLVRVGAYKSITLAIRELTAITKTMNFLVDLTIIIDNLHSG